MPDIRPLKPLLSIPVPYVELLVVVVILGGLVYLFGRLSQRYLITGILQPTLDPHNNNKTTKKTLSLLLKELEGAIPDELVFYQRLHSALRKVLSKQGLSNARSLTTTELLEQAKLPDASQQDDLRVLLNNCDRVLFGKQLSSIEERQLHFVKFGLYIDQLGTLS
jgi:hypothetical protein